MLPVLAGLLIAAVDVRVELLSGDTLTGTLSELDESALSVDTADGPSQRPLTDVVRVTLSDVSTQPPSEHQGRIRFADETMLTAGLTALNARTAQVASIAGKLTLPRSRIRAVRLAEEHPDWSEQWHSFLARKNDEDLLILKKRDGSGLDFYGGIISGATEDEIAFVLDGDAIPVPRHRVYGLIFSLDDVSEERVPVRIVLADESVLAAASVRLNGESFQVETAWKETVELPLSNVSVIDFSAGRFHYLSDLDPIRETYSGIHPDGPVLDDLFGDDRELRDAAWELWKMHRDQVPMGSVGPLPLTLRGTTYRKGLWLFPSCRIDYALDGRYSRLLAVVGVDDEVAFDCVQEDGTPSRVQLTILADGDEIWEANIEATADPVTLNLDLKGRQTLSLIVDFGDGDSACDFLDLADARLLVVP